MAYLQTKEDVQDVPVSSKQLYSRLATEADAEAVLDLINLAFKGHVHLVMNRLNMDELRSYMKKGYFLLAEEKDQLVGVVYAEFRDNGRAYLGFLAVHPEKRKSGLGQQLHQASELFCKERGCKFVEGLVVNLRMDLIERYRRFGYEIVDVLPSENYPQLEGHLDVPWHLFLIEKKL